MQTQKLLFTKSQAADLLSISVRTLEHLIANEELEVCRVGRRVLITARSLDRFTKTDHDMPRQEGKESYGRT